MRLRFELVLRTETAICVLFHGHVFEMRGIAARRLTAFVVEHADDLMAFDCMVQTPDDTMNERADTPPANLLVSFTVIPSRHDPARALIVSAIFDSDS